MDDILNKYHIINNFTMVFSTNAEQVNNMLGESDGLLLYAESQSQMRGALAELLLLSQSMGRDSYLLIRAIQGTYWHYEEEVKESWRMVGRGDAIDFSRMEELAGAINTYTNQLLNTGLAYGYDSYEKLLEEVVRGRVASIAIMWVAVACNAFFGCYIMLKVIDPMISLSHASMEIAKENFDVDNIITNSKDEIGTLTRSFDKMKNTMVETISQLREQQELDQKLHENELKVISNEKLLDEARLSLLQSQINPHFLFNAMNVISGMAELEDAKVTKELILNLSSLFRYSLETNAKTVPLYREMQIIKHYIQIEKRRFGDRLRFSLKADVDLSKYIIPTFTLQPLVENSIKHGILVKENGGSIRIKIHTREDNLIIYITDNGVGIDPQTMEEIFASNKRKSPKEGSMGMGVGNVTQRLSMIFPQSQFSLRSKAGFGTSIRIKIALEDCFYVPLGNS